MLRQLFPLGTFVLAVVVSAHAGRELRAAEAGPAFDLTARAKPGDALIVMTSLEVGGELLVPAESGEESKLPLSVVAKLNYSEQLVDASSDSRTAARSVRRYTDTEATIKTNDTSVRRELPADRRIIVAELSDLGFAARGLETPLSRDEFDLIDAVGTTLALDRLLPGKALREGDGWDHDAAAIGALLGMDHVAVCDVRSVVTGEDQRQVQIRMAGTVHGTVDGAATEMELRAAYLYHLDRGRVTRLNMAVKERRKAGEVSPGLDVVAKVAIVTTPIPPGDAPAFDAAPLAAAAALSRAELRELLVDAPARGYRFRHDVGWFVTAEQRELMSLRLLDEGEYLAHCNVATAPPRPADKPLELADFEREVVKALGEKVSEVAAATEWTTPQGNRCLGVFVDGTVNDLEVQWRYYNLSTPGAQVTVSVTVEQGTLERFADADRALVDSLELVPLPAKTVAASVQSTTTE